MRIIKSSAVVCALALVLSFAALPAAAIPWCYNCNCNTPCATSCWADPGFLSHCWSAEFCKETCDFLQVNSQDQENSLETFLMELEQAAPEVEATASQP